jgi:outer membrane murein-binding lipoprotein Lpp
MLLVVLLAGCGSRTQPEPEPVKEPDAVAALLCPLATAPAETEADVKALAERAEAAQKAALSQAFDPKYRPLTSASFALAGAATSLASINAQVSSDQRSAVASSAPFLTFKQGLAQAQADLASACKAL